MRQFSGEITVGRVLDEEGGLFDSVGESDPSYSLPVECARHREFTGSLARKKKECLKLIFWSSFTFPDDDAPLDWTFHQAFQSGRIEPGFRERPTNRDTKHTCFRHTELGRRIALG